MEIGDRDILEEFTKKRLAELRKQTTLKEITDEMLLLRKTQKDTLLVHFYHKDFIRCKEMNKALEELAMKYPTITFLCAEAIQFPFITEKLEIKELPYLASFSKGFFIGGIIGFQDIGETSLDIQLLEQYIVQSDLLDKSTSQTHQ
ncbi:hypothetical protein NEOKW01_0467 [Nematocida sp. AWRm80]|nr:hypothetical protein NEOKW01_0467 [Nematocida sp. AWRm80]